MTRRTGKSRITPKNGTRLRLDDGRVAVYSGPAQRWEWHGERWKEETK